MKAVIELQNPVIAVAGEIDLANVEGFRLALEPSIQAGGPVPLDMSGVTFMDSTGIHALVEAARALGDRGCIIVHGAHGAVAKVMEITGVAEDIGNLHVIKCSVLVEQVA